MRRFEIGDTVKVNSPGHHQDGQIGPIIYYSNFMGTWGVEVDGQTYGFLSVELTKEPAV